MWIFDHGYRSNMKQFIVLCASVILIGCGSRLDSASTPAVPTVSFSGFSAINAPAIVNATGITVSGSYTWDGAVVDSSNMQGTDTSTNVSSQITYRTDGTISNLTLANSFFTKTYSEADAGTDINIGTFTGALNGTPLVIAEDATSQALFYDPLRASNPFEYQTFGTLITGRGTGSGNFGGFSLGTMTSGSSIPTSGNAAYTGFYGGAALSADGSRDFTTAGSLSVALNFATRSGTITATNSFEFDQIAATGWAAASSRDFSGALNYSTSTNSLTGTLTSGSNSGTVDARFYGPNAEEIGGVFDINLPGIGRHAGAFGAEQ